ncbi:TPA: hypothetical protein DEG21_02855 [Patescibacteria group bacterium]|nr:hypothetical protein [Candidatus Gracilibacteria bacterium]
MDLEAIKQEINKTGFILEYNISELLEKYHWHVINSRYYLDDITKTHREIDILAYKVKEVENVLYYTSLIISCKKSCENAWLFLTKNIKNTDPNIEIMPVLNWTNIKSLDFMIKNKPPKNEIIKFYQNNDYLNTIYDIKSKVFAFQQMKISNSKPNNDKDIYDSIITVIKAFEYEKQRLDNQKGKQAFYNFNLLSVFDGTLLNQNFLIGSAPSISTIDNIKYLNRHIINQKEDFYLVHFVNYPSFENLLNHFNKLHEWNISYYPKAQSDFFNDVFDDENKINIYWNEIKESILPIINTYMSFQLKLPQILITDIRINKFDKSTKLLHLSYYTNDLQNHKIIDAEMNKDSLILNILKTQLQIYYNYTNNFVLEYTPF